MILIGYSGHAHVICDTIISSGQKIDGYCEQNSKEDNPYTLEYLGIETDQEMVNRIKSSTYFIAVGSNTIRHKIYKTMLDLGVQPPSSVVHPSAIISPKAQIYDGVYVGAGVIINSGAQISTGAICNTASVIEHGCTIGEFSHIAPSAVLCGDVQVGHHCHIGANAVLREGIVIGNNSVIGAGAVVIKNIEPGSRVAGNPQRPI